MSLQHLANSVRLADEMTKRREMVREIYGDRYAEAIRVSKRLVQMVAKQDGLSLIQAGLKICKQAVADGSGSAVSLIIAATLDLIDEGAAP